MNRSDLPDNCSYCGDRLQKSEWHPIRATHDSDGEFRIYAFCNEACRQAWEATRDAAPTDETTGDS